MRSARPPRIATWLLQNFGCGPNQAAVIGDLEEQYRKGRSRTWYWRQVLVALGNQYWRTISDNSIDGGQVMVLKIAITCLLLGFLLFFSTVLALHASDPDALFPVGKLISIDGLVVLILLTLRGVWRTSSKALRILQWPTAIAVGVVGICGMVLVSSTLWSSHQTHKIDIFLFQVGLWVVMVCVLAGLALSHTRHSNQPKLKQTP